jgi:hypothetical protein
VGVENAAMAAHGFGYWMGRVWVWIRRTLWASLGLVLVLLAVGNFMANSEDAPAAATEKPLTPEQVSAREAARERSRQEVLAAQEPIAADTKAHPRARLEAIAAIAAVDQDRAAKLEPLRERMQAAYDRELQANRDKVAAAERARKKREGVAVGMSVDDVLSSSWGKPQSVNRTTTALGVNEQWVYGGGNYLYFTNGKLTAIQN